MTADEIKKLRSRLGLSQTAFAMRVGVTVDAIRQYEQGRISPGVRAASILSQLEASTAKQKRVTT